MTTSDS